MQEKLENTHLHFFFKIFVYINCLMILFNNVISFFFQERNASGDSTMSPDQVSDSHVSDPHFFSQPDKNHL